MGLEVRDGGSQGDSKHKKDLMCERVSIAGFEGKEFPVARNPGGLSELRADHADSWRENGNLSLTTARNQIWPIA